MTAMMAEAARPWAGRNQGDRPGGWQMLVELVDAQAEMRAGLLTVEIEMRTTLRSHDGPIALGQNHNHCRVTGVDARNPSSAMYQCLQKLARDLAGWLETARP